MATKTYMRVFESGETIEWLRIHKPHRCDVIALGEARFRIEGPADQSRSIDNYVNTFEQEASVSTPSQMGGGN
jgi:hypothetical protein